MLAIEDPEGCCEEGKMAWLIPSAASSAAVRTSPKFSSRIAAAATLDKNVHIQRAAGIMHRLARVFACLRELSRRRRW